MIAFVGCKGGHVTILFRLIAVLLYTIVTVHIIRYHDGPYLKESSSMIVVENNQNSNEENSNSESPRSDSFGNPIAATESMHSSPEIEGSESPWSDSNEDTTAEVVPNHSHPENSNSESTWSDFFGNPTAATESIYSSSGTPNKVVRLLCWVMTDPAIIQQAVDARNTWMRGCDIRLIMSSQEDKVFPAIGLNVTAGRDHIAEKSKAAWTYVYKNHRNDAEFFVKADPDSYVVVENLKRYLANCDPDEPAIYGHNLYIHPDFHYVAGEAVVLGRESLNRLITRAIFNRKCFPPGQGEDLKTSLCLSMVGGYTIDTRDERGRETFLPPFRIKDIADAVLPEWYTAQYRLPYGFCQSLDCLSDYPIVFHYVLNFEFYILDYLLRKNRIQFQSNPFYDDPQFRFNGTRYRTDYTKLSFL